MPQIDIVIPCYNYAHFLPQCVGSVASQGVDNIRIIIIDNASSDDSVAVARRLAANDPRIEVVCHETNVGPHASFNEGVDLASGDYFMILCADDLMIEGALRQGLEILESNPKVAFVLGANTGSLEGDATTPQLQPAQGGRISHGIDFVERCCLSTAEGIPAHAVLVRGTVQKEAGYYRSSLPYYDDVELVLRFAVLGDVAELNIPIAVPRMHTTNISTSLWQDRLRVLKEREAVFHSFFSQEGACVKDRARLHRTSTTRIGEAAYWSAVSHLFRGRVSQGIALLRYAFELNPLSRFVPPLGHLYRTQGAFDRALAILSSRMPAFGRQLENHR